MPLVIVLSLATLYAQVSQIEAVRGACRAVSASASGLIVATALKLARPLRTAPWQLVICAAAFVGIALLRIPLLWMLAATLPVIDRARLVEARMIPPLLLEIALQFFVLSLLSIGGANAVIPEIQRRVVETHHWMTDEDFAQLFALSQAAPGPNVLDREPGWLEGRRRSRRRGGNARHVRSVVATDLRAWRTPGSVGAMRRGGSQSSVVLRR